jgi:hypothetical protein
MRKKRSFHTPLFTPRYLCGRSGFIVYAGGCFIEIRTEKGCGPPVSWPANKQEGIAYFRTSRAIAGRCVWLEGKAWGWGHEIMTAADPRLKGPRQSYVAQVDGDSAQVEITKTDGTRVREAWRRLSGAGSSPLAGAWESMGANDHWCFWLQPAITAC